MPIKQRIAARNPKGATIDAHVRFALRAAIAKQKQVIEDNGSFDSSEAQIVADHERLTFYERLLRQEDLLRIEA